MSYKSLLSLIKRLDQNEAIFSCMSAASDALDALLINTSFEPALLQSQHQFWISFGFDTRNETYSEEEYNEVSFKELQKEAATQRVRLNMSCVVEKVLINMLRHNKQQCYEYLQQHKNVDMLPLSVFQQAPELVSDELFAIEATAQLLLRVSEKIVSKSSNSGDLSALHALIALDDLDEFKKLCIDDKWMKYNEWLDQSLMQQIQAAACITALKLQIKNNSPESDIINSIINVYKKNKEIPLLSNNALRDADQGKNSFTLALSNLLCKGKDFAKQHELKHQLDKILSVEHYERIVHEHRKEQWASYDEDTLLFTAQDVFVALRTQQNTLLQAADIMHKIENINQNGFAFEQFIKAQNAEFDNDVKQIENELFFITDQLQKNINALDNLILSLSQRQEKQIEQYRLILLAEQKKWIEQLNECRAAFIKVTTASIEFERIRSGAEHYFFTSPKLTTRTLSETELQEIRVKRHATIENPRNLDITTIEDDVLKKASFTQHTLYTFSESQSNSTIATGLFVQSIDRAKIINGLPVSRVELLQSALCVLDGKVSDVLMPAKVSMYFDMALALLVAEEGKAPTKKRPIYISNGTAEQQEWIWTALVLLGEQKFNFTADALVVKGILFSPEQVKSKSLFFATGFINKSIYKQIHNDPAAKKALDAKMEEADKICVQINQDMGETAVLVKSIGHFRNKVQQIKSALEHTSELIERDGVAVAHTNTRTVP